MATPEQIYGVINLIEAGHSERSACDKHGLNRNTFRSAAFRLQASDQYARALAALAQEQVEKVELVIEEVREGLIPVDVATLEINTRKWFASKFLPKRYGEKLNVEAKTETTVHVTDSLDLAQLTADQRQALRDIADALLERRGQAQIAGPEGET